MGNLGLKSRAVALEFGHTLAAFGLLGVVFGHTVLPKTSEGNPLFQKLGLGRFATGRALSHGFLRNADLTGTLDNSMLQNGTLTLLGPQRLGNL